MSNYRNFGNRGSHVEELFPRGLKVMADAKPERKCPPHLMCRRCKKGSHMECTGKRRGEGRRVSEPCMCHVCAKMDKEALRHMSD